MYTHFLPRRMEVDLVNNRVTFAICRIRPHSNTPECLSQTFVSLDLFHYLHFLVNRTHPHVRYHMYFIAC